jgi:quinol monooxygenase YgiN
MTITVRAEFRVEPAARDAFLAVSRELRQRAAAEAGTVRYDWYDSDDPAVVVVLEEYADADAALAHQQNCAPLLERALDLARPTAMHLHGDLGPVIEGWAAHHPFAHVHRPLP